MGRRDLPAGTVTFLFTDVEGSTRMLEDLGEVRYADALAKHRRSLHEAFERHGGVEVDTEGDAIFTAFPTAPGALAAAREAQAALQEGPIRVRMGLHTGAPLRTDEGYVGIDVHRAARIAAAGHGGQVLISLATAALVPNGDVPLTDLGEHRLKDLTAPERIYQLGGGAFPRLNTLSPSNLPVPASPFVGRGAELSRVVEILGDRSARLLTLTGPGGIGKTRLALQAAAELSLSFPDGLWWVALLPIRDAELVPAAVAQTLAVREEEGKPLEQSIAEHLSGRRVLLLLDNAEHLLPALATVVAGLLSLTKTSALLVTSRERLQIGSEQVLPVPAMNAVDAEEFIIARAAAIGIILPPSEALTALCERLDRMPLALQLAAGRLPLFSVKQLLDRLSDRLDLLGGGRDSEPRQQTLRATIQWSHDLLAPQEQALLRRLAVFRGGCTMDAAEAVCGARADQLQGLIDKSLLQRRDDAPEPRFWMLESIWQFTTERLEGSDEVRDLRARHAGWFRMRAKEIDARIRAGDPEEGWVALLEADVDNLRAAVAFGLETDDRDLVRALSAAMPTYWIMRGRLREGRRWLEQALNLGGEEDDVTRRLLAGLASIAYAQGDYHTAVTASDQAAALAGRLGGMTERFAELDGRARAAFLHGDLETAQGLFEEAFQTASDSDNGVGMSGSRLYLAEIANLTGRHARAEVLLNENLPFVRSRGQVRCEASTLGALAHTSWHLGRPRAAAEGAVAGGMLAPRIGDDILLAFCLESYARAVAELGEPERAAQILGSCEAARDEVGAGLDAHEVADHEGLVDRLTGDLGESTFKGLRMEGQSLDLASALALADSPRVPRTGL